MILHPAGFGGQGPVELQQLGDLFCGGVFPQALAHVLAKPPVLVVLGEVGLGDGAADDLGASDTPAGGALGIAFDTGPSSTDFVQACSDGGLAVFECLEALLFGFALTLGRLS